MDKGRVDRMRGLQIASCQATYEDVWWERVIAVRVKKLVAIVVLVAIVSLVPLQTLAQIEPRVTYTEWCAHLDELYARLDPVPSRMWLYGIGLSAVVIGGVVAALSDSWILSTGLVSFGVISVFIWLGLDRENVAIEREIAEWTELGKPYFWFYPCE